MEARSYGGSDGYWTFRGPIRDTPGNGTFYDPGVPYGTISPFTENSIAIGIPQITEEEIVLIRLSW